MDFDPQQYERIRYQKIIASQPPVLDEIDEAILQGKAIGRLDALKPRRPWTELNHDPNWKDGR